MTTTEIQTSFGRSRAERTITAQQGFAREGLASSTRGGAFGG